MTIEAFWQAFLQENKLDPATFFIEAFHFDMTEDAANYLLQLVLEGKKRATSSSYTCYQVEGEPMPQVGEYSIVTDWAGEPHCVIRTTSVRIIPFRDMTFDICRLEGEDECLETWQQTHIDFFTAEGQEAGYAFSWDMPVVFEEFEVVYKR